MKIGDLKLEWQRGRYDNAKLHEFLGHWIYQDQTLTDLAKPAPWGGLGVLLVSLVVAIPRDGARRRKRKHGRRLKGPELVTARAFNRRNRSDGIGFLQQQSFTQKILRRKAVSVKASRAFHPILLSCPNWQISQDLGRPAHRF